MIEMKAVRFSYGKRSHLFDGLDFSIDTGGVYGLLGKNGAGKTTMLKLAAGLRFPHAGDITLFGHPAYKRRPDALARLAFVPEEVAVPPIRIADFATIYGGYYPRFDAAKMSEYMERFEVPRAGRMDQFSLGQKKKALLALAFASGADLVFLDEPTNGLDIPSKQVFRRMVAESVGDERAFVISTHQVRDVQNLIDPIVILHEGTVVLHVGVNDLLSRVGVKRFPSERDAADGGAIVTQPDIGGVTALVPATPEDATESDTLDLELLFEAAIRNAEALV